MRILWLISLGISLTFSAMTLSGCASGYCRQVKKSVPQTETDKKLPTPVKDSPRADVHVLVYKYDGSLQCAMGQAASPEQMERELAPIKVFSRQKKADGLMHIQVCGQPTGRANVYEISEKDLALAEKRGFKKWDFE